MISFRNLIFFEFYKPQRFIFKNPGAGLVPDPGGFTLIIDKLPFFIQIYAR
jgi:hypothetical protein